MASVGRGLPIRGHFSTRLSAGQTFTHKEIFMLTLECEVRASSVKSELSEGDCV